MSRSGWQIFATLTLTVVAANAEPLDVRPSRSMPPLDRAQEVLRRLDLPPDPKLKGKVDATHRAQLACLHKELRAILRTGPTNDAIELACRRCDGHVVAYARASFEANKHRYIDPSLDAHIADQRKFCRQFTTTYEISREVADEVVTTSRYATFDGWSVLGEVTREGQLSYVLEFADKKSAITVRIACASATKAVTVTFLGPFKNDNATSFLTYFADAGSPKQLKLLVKDDRAYLHFPSGAPLEFIRALSRTERSLSISIQSIAAQFPMLGYPMAADDWLSRCR